MAHWKLTTNSNDKTKCLTWNEHFFLFYNRCSKCPPLTSCQWWIRWTKFCNETIKTFEPIFHFLCVILIIRCSIDYKLHFSYDLHEKLIESNRVIQLVIQLSPPALAICREIFYLNTDALDVQNEVVLCLIVSIGNICLRAARTCCCKSSRYLSDVKFPLITDNSTDKQLFVNVEYELAPHNVDFCLTNIIQLWRLTCLLKQKVDASENSTRLKNLTFCLILQYCFAKFNFAIEVIFA